MSEATTEDILLAAAQMRVVRGAPDDVEVAALVASLAAVASGDQAAVADEAAVSPWPRSLRQRDPIARAAASRNGDTWRWSLRS